MNFPKPNKVPIQKINLPLRNGIELYIKREDLVHPTLSGNKYWKLKYNFLEAKKLYKDTLISFGGAYSNHLYALASLGKLTGIQTIGIIRGEELSSKAEENPTLLYCKNNGMKLYFVSRAQYKEKEQNLEIKKIIAKYTNSYLIPEGGTNTLAVQGTQHILTEETHKYDYICCSSGTGGTLAGLSLSAQDHQKIEGFSALKGGDFLKNGIKSYSDKNNFNIHLQYHFGGYAKINKELELFRKEFFKNHAIPLDKVYTAKMMYGILDLIEKEVFPAYSKILAIHTGGLQGNN